MNLLSPLTRFGVVTGGTAAPVYRDIVMLDTPYAYWRFEETSGTAAADYSGNSRPGIYDGGPTLGLSGASAGTGLAVDLDGTNDHVRADFGIIDPTSRWNMTFECWVKADSLSGGRQCLMCSVQTTGSRPGHFMYLTGDDVSLEVHENSFFVYPMSATLTLPDTNWHHIVGTFSQPSGGNITGNLYLDGTSVASGVITSLFGGYSPNRVGVGAAFNGIYNENFAGLIDEAAFYSYVLSSAKVADHFAAL